MTDIGLEWQVYLDLLNNQMIHQDSKKRKKGKKCPGGYTIASNKKCRSGGVRSPGKRGSALKNAALAAGAGALGAAAVGGAYAHGVKKEVEDFRAEQRRKNRRDLLLSGARLGLATGLVYGAVRHR